MFILTIDMLMDVDIFHDISIVHMKEKMGFSSLV